MLLLFRSKVGTVTVSLQILFNNQWKGTNSNNNISQDLPTIEIGQDTDLLLSAVHSGEFLEMQKLPVTGEKPQITGDFNSNFFWIFFVIGATTRTWQEIQ